MNRSQRITASLARKLRLDAEQRLKAGEIKLLVATASSSWASISASSTWCVRLQSSRAIAVALQRVGRAGHWRGAIPKGRLFATTRDDLVECAALIRAINHGELDRVIIPDCPIDILAQQIVAEVSANSSPHLEEPRETDTCGDGSPRPSDPSEARGLFPLETGCDEDQLFDLLRRAYPYRHLTRTVFDEVLEMLSEGIAAQRGRYGAYLHRDRVNKRLRARRGAG